MLNPENLRILLVEDNTFDAVVVRDFLSSILMNPAISRASTLAEALHELENGSTFDLILLDLTLQDCYGVQTVRRMNAAAGHIPIIVLTGVSDDESAVMALRCGAQDYLIKGKLDPGLVLRSIRYSIERKRTESEIERLAFFDPLTGLANRRLLSDRLNQAILLHARKKLLFGVLFIDVDRFKQVNDLHGHDVGDLLLIEAASRFRSCIRASDTIARPGGDEFVILLGGITEHEQISLIARKILEKFREPIVLDDLNIQSTVSIGATVFPADGEDEKTLLRHADTAMYKAKEMGRDAVRFFDYKMNEALQRRSEVESCLGAAIDREEFFLHFQPQVSLHDGRVQGLEALVRWNHPEKGQILPGVFIPLAEKAGLIGKLGEWVLREACRQARIWNSSHLPGVMTGVNISARQFMDDTFVTLVESVLAETGLRPDLLELELTESVLMEQSDRAVRVLGRLRDMGVSLALDDFGTGYSSLNYLNLFPINRLKIDRSFILGINGRSDTAPIPRAIIGLAHTLGLSVVAEGVETSEQLDFLRHHQCDTAQGYFLGKPQPHENLPLSLRLTPPHPDPAATSA